MKILMVISLAALCCIVVNGDVNLSCPPEEPRNALRYTYSPQNIVSDAVGNIAKGVMTVVRANTTKFDAKRENSAGFLPRQLTQDQKDLIRTNNISCTQQIDTTVIYGYQFNIRNDTGNSSVCPIYDQLGTIAGVVVRINKTDLHSSPNYNFHEYLSLLYNNETVNGQEYTVFIAYFVDKSTICSPGPGRYLSATNETAIKLSFAIAGSDEVLVGPNYYSQAVNNSNLPYAQNNCFPFMGIHTFYNASHSQDSNCTVIVPVFLLFNFEGYLTGFGFSFVGKISATKIFEKPDPVVDTVILGKDECPCRLQLAKNGGLSAIHFFFTTRQDVCLPRTKPICQ